MRLSLSMIVKDGLDDLKRLQPLVEPHIDEWVVVLPPKDKAIAWAKKNGLKVIVKDFTQGIEPEVRQRFKGLGLEVEEDYRLFKFAEARNASLDACTGDYVLWLDADDEPKGLENIKALLKEASRADQFDAVYDYARDDEGNSISDHVRERVICNNGQWEWRGAELGLIHETLMPKEGFSPLTYTIPKKEFYVQHQSDHADESSERNFVALLYEYIKTDGKDARTIYYLGTELFNHKMYEQSIKILLEYIQVGGWDEERYRAWINIGHAYNQLKDPESSRNAYFNAIKELPAYPDAYLAIGESYHNSEQWAKSIEFLMAGLQKPLPKTKSAIDYTKYAFRPLVYLALNNMQLGKQQEAYSWYLKARKVNPNHPWIAQYADLFEDIKDLNDYVRAFVKLGQISQRKYKKNLSKLADAIPDELMNQELLLDFKRRYTTPKIWDKNSIVFWCSSAFEDWGPDSLKTGTGGSEEAIIQLAPRLVKLGWDVTVYNNCPQETIRDGVKWVRFEKFNPRDIFNILVSWRNNAFLDTKVASKKYVDVHDIPNAQMFPERSLKDVKMLVKSQYHRDLFTYLSDDKFVIIPNGINSEQFTNTNKVINNLVYTSSYDRGLEYLLEMWPDIRKAVPDATLDVAYGWNLFDVSPRGKTDEGRQWKATMAALLNQDGITHHGRLSSQAVAELYNKADVWAYPTDFPEISCITAIKAQAAGCIPVTSSYAALEETVQIDEDNLDMSKTEDREAFKNRLISVLKLSKREKDALRIPGETMKRFSWDVVAEEWNETFKTN